MTERWGKYMASREWALLKRAVKDRARNRCERCQHGPLDQIHHLTYIHAYHEHLEDLQGLCAPCHEYLSGVDAYDPMEAHQSFFDILDVQFIYEDGHTDHTTCRAQIEPAPMIEQADIDPQSETFTVRRFQRITPEQARLVIYEEFDHYETRVLEGNHELAQRILTLRHDSRTGTFHDVPPETTT